MKNIDTEDLFKISAAKNNAEFYEEVFKPVTIGIGTMIAGPGGGATTIVAIYGIEGLIEITPEIANALETINKINDAELKKIIKDPYSYPD